MDTYSANLARLTLLIQRILDADALSEAEGASLLIETEAAFRSLNMGHTEAVCLHVEQVVLVTEALVQTNRLDLEDGRAVIETACRLLTEDTH